MHLLGTLRQNRKLNLKAVTKAKLKRGEMKVQKNNTEVLVAKWNYKRDVLFLTTRAVPEMVEVPTNRSSVLKPLTNNRSHTPWYQVVQENCSVIIDKYGFSKFRGYVQRSYRKEYERYRLSRKYCLCYVGCRRETPNQHSKSSAACHRVEANPRHVFRSYKSYSEDEGRESAMRKAKKVYSFCPTCSESFTYICISCFLRVIFLWPSNNFKYFYRKYEM
nr:unnamed protein product [Callosobruchus analis]